MGLEDLPQMVYKTLMAQSWKDIREQYPNEHVVIASPHTSPETPAVIETGEVVDHDPDLDHLLHRCNLSIYENCAVKFTGDLGKLIGERGMIRIFDTP